MVTKSISFLSDPPANKALVPFKPEAPPTSTLATVRFPKSVALPADSIVTKSITSLKPGAAPPPRRRLLRGSGGR